MQDASLDSRSQQALRAPLQHGNTFALCQAAEDHGNFQDWDRAMKDGHYSLGWAINDRLDRHWPSAHKLWKSDALAGEPIDLTGLHGLGDVVQMLRFVPHLRQMGCKLRCFTRPELIPLLPLFSGMEGVECGTLEQGTVATNGGNALEFMELLYLLRLNAGLLPKQPYLHVPRALSDLVGNRMGPHLKTRVGVVWTGSAYDPDRWIPVKALPDLFDNKDIEWWNIQGGSAAQEAAHPNLRHAAEALPTPHLDSFCALLANLDLVITADTLAAHLAGAMGLPVWLLLKRDADWRWMRDRSDSPWYPTARMFRQHRAGDWKSVLKKVKQELDQI